MANNKKAGNQPRSLSIEEKEKIVEEVLGVHPKYLIKSGINLIVDISAMSIDGKVFNGFKHTEHMYR